MTFYAEGNYTKSEINEQGFLTEVSLALGDCLLLPHYNLVIVGTGDVDIFKYAEEFFEDKELAEVNEINRVITLKNDSMIWFINQYNYKGCIDINKCVVDESIVPEGQIIRVNNLQPYS